MKRILFALLFVLGSILSVSSVHAQSQSYTGNPIGFLDSATCSSAYGWSYDPDFYQPVIYGCTNPSATNYDPNATNDDGSCVIPTKSCVSRYRWVNINAGSVDQTQGCSAVGAVPVTTNISNRGFCASGENRPKSGYDINLINYSRGTWGGGNGGGGTLMPWQNGGYRCYQAGQKWDKDNTDVAVAYYCDFGSTYPESCPAEDNPPPPTTRYGGGGKTKVLLNFSPTEGFFERIASFFKPFKALVVHADSSGSNDVLIYEGDIDTGSLITTVRADQPRPDVNAVMGVSGNHGFSWTVPSSLRDGKIHTLSFYGTNTDGSGKDSELTNSSATIQCDPGSVNSAPSTPVLSCPENGSKTNTDLLVLFASSDADGNGVRYLIDWDANSTIDQIIPGGGVFAPSGSQESASRSWSTAGIKTVYVSAEDDQGSVSGNALCSFTLIDSPVENPPVVTTSQCSDVLDNDGDGRTDFPADLGCANASDDTEDTDSPVCTVNCGPAGDGGGNGANGGGNGSSNNGNVSGFTVSGTPKIAIQFLGGIGAISQNANLSVNSVSNFSDPVTLSVESIRSAQGTDLPNTVIPTYYFGGRESSSALMSYDSGRGYYVDINGFIGTTFAVKLSKKITEKYYITIIGISGAQRANMIVELNPNSVNPDFREI